MRSKNANWTTVYTRVQLTCAATQCYQLQADEPYLSGLLFKAMCSNSKIQSMKGLPQVVLFCKMPGVEARPLPWCGHLRGIFA